ncbi:MAG: hypothetical protein ABW275_11100 [Hansschlegelia sp.]
MIRSTRALIVTAALATSVLVPNAQAEPLQPAVAGFHDVLRSNDRRDMPGPRHCQDRWANFKHTGNDGHDHTMGPEHAGHGHGEQKRNHKGYKLKPRCTTEFGAAAPAPGLVDHSERAS